MVIRVQTKFRQLKDFWRFSVATLAKKLRKNSASLEMFCGYSGYKAQKKSANLAILAILAKNGFRRMR